MSKSLKILYFSHFYKPESIAASFRASDHAEKWVEAGHDVTVFSGWPNYPTGRLYDGYQMERLRLEEMNGVRLYRSSSLMQPNTSFFKRILAGASYVLSGLRNTSHDSVLKSGAFDVVLVTCGTVFSAWLGCHYARVHGLPFVIEFRDLTWKQMIAAGSRENSVKVRSMKRLELSFCKGAASVVVLTPGFKEELVNEGISPDRMTVVPNGADIVPCKHNWSNEGLRLGYFGTMGLSQDVLRTIRLIKPLATDGLVKKYELIGEGALREIIQSEISEMGHSRVSMSHGISKAQLEKHYEDVDMTIVSLKNSKSFEGTIPSKIFQSFARGVPVIYIGPEGDASHIVRDSGGGIALCGNDDDALKRLREFLSSPVCAKQVDEMSNNALSFIRSSYTRDRLARNMLDVLREAAIDITKES